MVELTRTEESDRHGGFWYLPIASRRAGGWCSVLASPGRGTRVGGLSSDANDQEGDVVSAAAFGDAL
jgi:hypothetical protein